MLPIQLLNLLSRVPAPCKMKLVFYLVGCNRLYRIFNLSPQHYRRFSEISLGWNGGSWSIRLYLILTLDIAWYMVYFFRFTKHRFQIKCLNQHKAHCIWRSMSGVESCIPRCLRPCWGLDESNHEFTNLKLFFPSADEYFILMPESWKQQTWRLIQLLFVSFCGGVGASWKTHSIVDECHTLWGNPRSKSPGKLGLFGQKSMGTERIEGDGEVRDIYHSICPCSSTSSYRVASWYVICYF